MFVHRYEDENVYFWSDLHLGHDRPFIIGPRGFDDIKRHDVELEKRIFEKVPCDAVLWLLGDTIFGPCADVRLLEFLKKIPPQEIILMPGNHFSGYKQLIRSFGRNTRLENGKSIRFVSNLEDLEICEQQIVASHYPHLSWVDAHKGSWMLHGHVHGRIPTSLPNNTKGGKILDLGVESTPEPMSVAEIRKIMAGKPFYQIDHHAQ